ncbi:MAG: hypothetical protein PHP98_03895 [Kiritimatiellae bacterium]|nr:hypothetical protein [Kiritimatiellia bacterium]
MKNKLLATSLTAFMAFCFLENGFAQQQPCCQAGAPFGPPGLKMQKTQPSARAEDWVNAWQAAKQACPGADTVAIQLVDRLGPSFQALKVFESVTLAAFGELLVITVKETKKKEEQVIVIRAADMVRIEAVRRAGAQD